MDITGMPEHDPSKQFVTEDGEIVDLPAFPFDAIFKTPFEQHEYKSRIGMRCTVTGRDMDTDPDVLLYQAVFADGFEGSVNPEEVGDGEWVVLPGGETDSGTKLS